MIPKLIHQIWIGTRRLSDEHAGFMQQWKSMHSDYEYVLWDNARVISENIIPSDKQKYFEPHEPRWPVAMQADMLRYEILRKYGGVYADVDCEPLKRIDPFLDCQCFLGQEFEEQVAIGIFGAVPQSQLFIEVCNSVVDNLNAFIERETIWALEGAVDRATGPGFFTRICQPYRQVEGYRFMSTKYFYPYWFKEDRPVNSKEAFPEAYSVHHWAKNWV